MITMSFAGRIGKTAEVRNLQNGDEVTSFTVACSIGKDKTQWVNCAIFGERGPKLAPYLTKGASVGISGRPSARGWKANDGEARADLQCAVDQVALLGSKSDSHGGGDSGGYGGGSAPQGKPPMGGPNNDMSDEIPFGPEVR